MICVYIWCMYWWKGRVSWDSGYTRWQTNFADVDQFSQLEGSTVNCRSNNIMLNKFIWWHHWYCISVINKHSQVFCRDGNPTKAYFPIYLYLLIYRMICQWFVPQGTHNLSKNEISTQTFGIDKMVVHRRFQTDKGFAYDIGLIKLSRPAVLNFAVGLACLPRQGDRVPVGTKCYLSGSVRNVQL